MNKSKWGENTEEGPAHSGLNLWVAYSLLALGLLGAVGIAAAIIYPFYLRR